MTPKERKQEIKKLQKQLRDLKKKSGGSAEDAMLDLELKIQELEVGI